MDILSSFMIFNFRSIVFLCLCLSSLSACSDNGLFDAVLSDDQAKVSRLLESGANPNVAFENHSTLLHYVKSGSVAQVLIDYGANVNAATEYGNTPLHATAALGDYEVALVLITNGANVNARNCNGYAPLHWAVSEMPDESAFQEHFYMRENFHLNQSLQLKIADELISHSANITIRTNSGLTPLHVASQGWGRLDSVTLLVRMGAQVNAKDINGWTPLRHAESGEATQVYAYLLSNGGVK